MMFVHRGLVHAGTRQPHQQSTEGGVCIWGGTVVVRVCACRHERDSALDRSTMSGKGEEPNRTTI